MFIPDAILNQLYVPGSFTQKDNRLHFTLTNPLMAVTLTSMALEVDGKALPSAQVIYQVEQNPPVHPDAITPQSPQNFPIGLKVEFDAQYAAPVRQSVVVDLVTNEIGHIRFALPGVGSGLKKNGLFANLFKKSNRFSARDWQRVWKDSEAWWSGDLKRPLLLFSGWADYLSETYASLPLDMPMQDFLKKTGHTQENTTYSGDAFPRWWANFGPGLAAAFLGAEVYPRGDTAWIEKPEPVDIHTFSPQYDPNNPWWKRILEVTRATAKAWGKDMALGLTDLGGDLDILASLRGSERLLMDLYDAPDDVERIVSEINTLWLRYYNELAAVIEPYGKGVSCWGPLFFPGRGYYLQCDFGYMISPAMYERFALPGLAKVCKALDYPLYHLDGKNQIKHLDLLFSIPELKAIQWVPGEGQPPADHWLPLLERIRKAGRNVQVLVSAEGARTIVRALGGKGFAFEITDLLSPEESAALVKELT